MFNSDNVFIETICQSKPPLFLTLWHSDTQIPILKISEHYKNWGGEVGNKTENKGEDQ